MIGRALRTGLSRLRRLAASRLSPAGFNPSRWWRSYIRGLTLDMSRDLRLVKPAYRHLYRDRILSGSTGYALQALIEAWRNDHRKEEVLAAIQRLDDGAYL